MELLSYENGKLSYITRWVDSGFLHITLEDCKKMTVFQVTAFKVIDLEIRKWRAGHKPMVIY